MRYLILIMALFSAFFVSGKVEYAIASKQLTHEELSRAEPLSVDLFYCEIRHFSSNDTIEQTLDLTLKDCYQMGYNYLLEYKGGGYSDWNVFDKHLGDPDCALKSSSDLESSWTCTRLNRYRHIDPNMPEKWRYKDVKVYFNTVAYSPHQVDMLSCPPEKEPMRKVGPVNKDDEAGKAGWCYSMFDVGQDYCPEFGSNSIISKGNNASAQICYTSPSGDSCVYELQGGHYKSLGQSCESQPQLPDYQGDPDLPDPDNCQKSTYEDFNGTTHNYATCPINPDKYCQNANVNGEFYSICPEGCGLSNDIFVCSGDDSDGDGIPDIIDENNDPNPDPNPNPDPDPNPDPSTNPYDAQNAENLVGILNAANNINNKATQANNTLNSISSKLTQVADSNALIADTLQNGITVGSSNSDGDSSDIDLSTVEQNTQATSTGIGDINKALTEQPDTQISEFNPTDQSNSWWVREYENGVKGVWEEKYPELQQTELFTFLNTLVVSGGGSAPDMTMDFSALGLGQGTLNIDPRVYAFLSIFFLVVTGFTCRKIIFGG